MKMKKNILLGFMFVALIPIFTYWYLGSIQGQAITITSLLFAFGRLAGLLAVVGVLLQFLMMGRTRWIETAFGLDKLTNIHRLNGYLTLSFLITHPILLTVAYATTAKTSFLTQFLSFLSDYEDVLQAFVALIIFVIIVVLSVYIVKKKLKYEWWYYVHIFTYLAVLLAWGHQLELGGDFVGNNLFVFYWYALYIFVFGNVLYFRFITPLYRFFYHRFAVDKIVEENDQVVSIYITGIRLDQFNFKAGQFVILRFLDRKRFYEAHPFSLSATFNGKYLRITPKDIGDFTHEIKNIRNGTPVIVDGPYGIFTPEVRTKDKVLFIAGGIGITPIRAMIEKMGAKNIDMTLIYSCKTESDMVFHKELSDLSKKTNLKMICIATDDPVSKLDSQRLDQNSLIKLVPDIDSRDIYICGPQPMIGSIREILKNMNVQKSQIHFEKFAL